MPPRTRRSAAVAAAALVADMQMESEPEEEEEEEDEEEEEEQVDIENDDEDGEGEEGDEDEDAESEEQDSDAEEEEEEEEEEPVVPQPRLKITLKLPANNTSSNSGGTATPDDQENDYVFTRTPRRRAKTKVIQDIDVESEDPTSNSDSEEKEQSAPSRSTGTPSGTAGPSTKPMTTRQAVLASVVDPSHVSLNEGTRSKKQPLNETELALRREETARKRKNLSEKKLQDEKAETINRLLKKQSRPKNKRNNTGDDRSPMPGSGARTPKVKTAAAAASKNGNGEDGEDAEGDEDEEDAMEIVPEPVEEVKPVMYRWVSTIRALPPVEPITAAPANGGVTADGEGGMKHEDVDMQVDKEADGKQMVVKKEVQVPIMRITFSIPELALARHPPPPTQPNTVLPTSETINPSNSTAMQVDDDNSVSKPSEEELQRQAREKERAEKEARARGPGVCAVDGCGLPRKYRHPGDWTVGACGMGHLKEVGRLVERRAVV
ncbi:hypothetical protein JR316_0004320 [Psilocybe cubensis]|uniref:INO80 complex subunit B-like conserved region domain-containing protein n=2 Tax=Psilocybe cubensis TaxID=181762 RepID=A0A8H7XXU2_PSICU|nr:hypothetical protein JR316_0004320 [Psilocybe cubensis]KAH9482223.1 hypothetical protein JR316_0004320 [Psilocybe cubensis]